MIRRTYRQCTRSKSPPSLERTDRGVPAQTVLEGGVANGDVVIVGRQAPGIGQMIADPVMERPTPRAACVGLAPEGRVGDAGDLQDFRSIQAHRPQAPFGAPQFEAMP